MKRIIYQGRELEKAALRREAGKEPKTTALEMGWWFWVYFMVTPRIFRF